MATASNITNPSRRSAFRVAAGAAVTGFVAATALPAMADPIFEAIEAHRRAVDIVNGQTRTLSDEEVGPLMDEIKRTWVSFVHTQPTSLQGALAFVSYGIERADDLREYEDPGLEHALTTLRSAISRFA